MGRKKKKEVKKKSRKISLIFGKFLKSIIAIVLISALILGISLFVRGVSNVDRKGLINLMSTLFTKLNIDSKRKERIVTSVNLTEQNLVENEKNKMSGELLFKICIISDIHQDKDNLIKALEKVNASGCRGIFVIGDVTNYGDTDSLEEMRDILNSAGIDYYVIPGDHDLAESVNVNNFNDVFGINYHLVGYEGTSFLLIDNSPNYTKISSLQLLWIESNIDKVDFVVLSQPLFTEGLNVPFDGIFMGSSVIPPEDILLKKKQLEVKELGEDLLDMIRKNENVKAVFAGEHHRSSEIVDSKRSNLYHFVIGAITNTVNDFPQNAIQTSRFSILSIYDNEKYFIEDILLD